MMRLSELIGEKDLSFLSLDSGAKWSENSRCSNKRTATEADKNMFQTLRDKRLTLPEISALTGFSKGFISKNTTAPAPLDSAIGVGELINKIQDGYVFDKELTVTKNKKPIFKLVPIEDKANEL